MNNDPDSDSIYDPVKPHSAFLLTNQHANDMFRLALYDEIGKISGIVRKACGLDAKSWPDDRLIPHSKEGIERAIKYGMACLEDVVGFLMLLHLIGQNFDQLPAIRQELKRTDLPSVGRIEALFLHLPLAVWDIAKRRT